MENKNYAVKTINASSEEELKEKMNEIELHKAIKNNDCFVMMKENFVENYTDPETCEPIYRIRIVMP